MMQTVKPRARPHKWNYPGVDETMRYGWRVTFPGWGVGFVSETLTGALNVAFQMRLTRQTQPVLK